MTTLMALATDHAATILALRDAQVDYSALNEVIAGCLGYETFALSIEEEGVAEPCHSLGDAEALVLNIKLGAERAVNIYGASEPFLTACLEGLEQAAKMIMRECKMSQMSVYRGFKDFYLRHVHDDVRRRLIEEGWEESTLSMLHPTDDDEPSALWTTSDHWVLACHGTCKDGDGNTLATTCSVRYAKAGRAGLIFEAFESNFSLLETLYVSLEVFVPDIQVLAEDGSVCRPRVTLICDNTSMRILGSAVGDTEDTTELALKALEQSLGRPVQVHSTSYVHRGQAQQYFVDASELGGNESFKQCCERLNLAVQPSRGPKAGGLVERLFGSLSTNPFHRRLNFYWQDENCVVTMEEFMRLLTAKIERYNDSDSERRGLTPGQR
ncbi:hypothetical protein IAE40_00795 [Pseudomonas sp. S44]|uniref:hypothetical protein n=1 Tax=Pseudomonas sp. S44 TaxID=2767450 RepID=UPI00190B4B04|nr:hypothetical protein [Pseudomonas sp. S44]MBK0057152.1 hypothetical protein [Pseudomonas sp. S44]